jgi:hypothetical protein
MSFGNWYGGAAAAQICSVPRHFMPCPEMPLCGALLLKHVEGVLPLRNCRRTEEQGAPKGAVRMFCDQQQQQQQETTSLIVPGIENPDRFAAAAAAVGSFWIGRCAGSGSASRQAVAAGVRVVSCCARMIAVELLGVLG